MCKALAYTVPGYDYMLNCPMQVETYEMHTKLQHIKLT